jgi:hypothetical protein
VKLDIVLILEFGVTNLCAVAVGASGNARRSRAEVNQSVMPGLGDEEFDARGAKPIAHHLGCNANGDMRDESDATILGWRRSGTVRY